MSFECWCGDRHNLDEPTPYEAWRTLGHSLWLELRIPKVVDWLKRRLNR